MSLSGNFTSLNISASGMRAQRIRQNVISSNLANVETTRTKQGGPYRRQFAVFEAGTKTKDTKLINNRRRVSGSLTNKRHMTIPPDRFPKDQRFFGSGVDVPEIREDTRPPKMVHDPSHPDAGKDGYVAMPNVNVVKEMSNMISATRAYEANVTAFNASKNMFNQAMQI